MYYYLQSTWGNRAIPYDYYKALALYRRILAAWERANEFGYVQLVAPSGEILYEVKYEHNEILWEL